ncbi:hypothetical protein D9619_007522 [Psilocybe cf. subviscida]|uniref:Peroxidase n=1 Tax=Psilocybe cf. subviscida TaxID=2480587 RepID=A0A8H5B3L9_9AGAR|nr:hypothetical protein D9619_007522 [Psilocybe cf. subviscida]
MHNLLLFLAVFTLQPFSEIPHVEAKYQWPSVQYEFLEGLLFEGTDMLGTPVAQLSEGCKKRDPDAPSSTVAAEWVRFAYHDMATFNATDGTGGLDASLLYELFRPENVGSGMISTLFDFAVSSSVLLSRADLIAMAVTWAVATCGGPVLPFRAGRKDASKAGRPGVPEPQQPLSEHTESFRLQGFTPNEMIALVACGHTLGAVRNLDFPTIVPPNANTSLDNVQTFDSTIQFDTTVVTEYLKGTTNNPLVVNANDTIRSDFRIFSSDRNATMRGLNSAKDFKNTCSSLLTRMIDTVPRDVTLTEQIIPIPFKVAAQFIFVGEQLVFDVKVRVLNSKSSRPESRKINMVWCDRRGARGGCSGGKAMLAQNPNVPSSVLLSPVGSALGLNFTQYEFAVPVTFERSVGSFWFEVNDGADKKHSVVIEDNGGAGYWAPDDALVFIPVGFFNTTLQFIVLDGLPTPYYVALGIHSSTNVQKARVSAFDTSYFASDFDVQVGPRDHLNATFDLALNQTMPPRAGYTFYSTEINNARSLGLTLDFEATSPLGTKRLDLVVGRCAALESLGDFSPQLTTSTDTNLSLLANGTHRN